MRQHIDTDRLTLRMLDGRDFPAYAAYYTAPERTGGVGGPLPAHKVFERFCAMIGHWTLRGFGRLGICIDPSAPAIGHVGPMQLTDDAPEMTWTLWSSDSEGAGYASEAARAVLNDLSVQGWNEILAHVDAGNDRSHAVARRLGGQPTGAAPAEWMPNATQYRFSLETPA